MLREKQNVDQLSEVDKVPTNTHPSHNDSQLYFLEAVIKMIIKRRSPTMRHVSRTHRVALGWILEQNQPWVQKPTRRHFDQKNFFAPKRTESTLNFSMFCCGYFTYFLSDDQVRKQSATQTKVRRRLRTKALRRRKRDHPKWRVNRGVRKSLHEVWDLWSIRRILMKEKKSYKHPGNWCYPTQIRKLDIRR